MSSLDGTVIVTREAFGDEHPDPSPGAIVVSVMIVVGDDGGDRNLGYLSSTRLPGVNSVIWFCLTFKASLFRRPARLLIMAWMYCSSRSAPA